MTQNQKSADPSTEVTDQRNPNRRQALAAATGFAALGALGFQRAASAEDMAGAITQTASFELAAGKEDEAKKVLAELIAAVEANEPGVLAYICHQETEAPNKVMFFEIYKDQDALDNHGKQPHLAKLGGSFGTLFMPPVAVVRMDRIAGFSR